MNPIGFQVVQDVFPAVSAMNPAEFLIQQIIHGRKIRVTAAGNHIATVIDIQIDATHGSVDPAPDGSRSA